MNTFAKFSLIMHTVCFAVCVAAAAQTAIPDDPTADPMQVARDLDRSGRELEARFYYGKALMQNPRNTAALSAIGLLEIRLGQVESARVHFERLKAVCAQCGETAQLERALAQP